MQVPNCVAKYNGGMLGVHLSDWKTQKYGIRIKIKKGYFPIVTHCLDVAVVNGCVLYNLFHDQKDHIDLLSFRSELSLGLLRLCGQGTKKSGSKIHAMPKEIALLGGTHVP